MICFHFVVLPRNYTASGGCSTLSLPVPPLATPMLPLAAEGLVLGPGGPDCLPSRLQRDAVQATPTLPFPFHPFPLCSR